MKLLNLLTFCAFAFVANTASAAGTLFDISGGTFSDGTSFAGNFEFDTVTHAFGSFSVATNAGTLPAFTYTNANSGAYYGGGAGPNNFALIVNNGTRYINFSFLNSLASGTQAINVASSYDC